MPASILSQPLSFVYSVFSDKARANKIYLNLLPSLKFVISAKGRSSAEAIGLMNILAGLPTVGAQRQNFEKFYVLDPDGWKKLPEDPNAIPYGHWH
ncbi:hypothetical protein GCM10009092_29430 [Bowmanella denitrificans]|uniref:Uncharacterized protein n=1 Tax=Bowmanella denitrificans TaxID=366582 RepID=A0ABP3H889_9ALTE